MTQGNATWCCQHHASSCGWCSQVNEQFDSIHALKTRQGSIWKTVTLFQSLVTALLSSLFTWLAVLSLDTVKQRIININEYFTFSLYSNVCRSLFEKHKLMFAFLLCARIMMNKNEIDMVRTIYFKKSLRAPGFKDFLSATGISVSLLWVIYIIININYV